MNLRYSILILFVFICFGIEAQEKEQELLRGRVISSQNKMLPYASIYLIQQERGAISNEDGFFTISIEESKPTDSIRFQYLGYQERVLSIQQLLAQPQVVLNEKINTLAEVLVYGDPPNPRSVIKQVEKNLEKNYPRPVLYRELFVRERYKQNISHLDLDHKKSSISSLDDAFFTELERKIPRKSLWYTDFLGECYERYEDDKRKLKLKPTKVVALAQEDLTELEEMEKIFEDLANETAKDEYWKVRTGILSQKLDVEPDTASAGSVPDTEGTQKLSYYNSRLRSQLNFIELEDEKEWEFLYNTGKYNYTMIGGSRMGDENVYIIDFEPSGSGDFKGRLYVSTSTYALLRADYSYAPGKLGTDIQLFGVGYTKNAFEASITFSKANNGYQLKYFSKREGVKISFDRKLTLMKKRERFLFDKELEEIKVKLDVVLTENNSIEVLVIDQKDLTIDQYNAVKEPERMKVIYVDQFRNDLWKGYSIIEPTQSMKDFKK